MSGVRQTAAAGPERRHEEPRRPPRAPPSRLGREPPAAHNGKGRILGKGRVLPVAKAQPKDRAPARLHLPRPRASATESDGIGAPSDATLLLDAVAFPGQDAYERQVAPSIPAAVGEVAAAPAKGALGAGRHVDAEDAGFRRPSPDHRPQVEAARSTGLLGHAQRFKDVRADFVALSADRRTRMDRQAGRVASESVGHGSDPGLDYALGDAPPPGVEQRDRAARRVGHEDGNAIGQRHRQEHSGGSGDVSVAVAGKVEPTADEGVDANPGSVDLPAAHDRAPRPVGVQGVNALRWNPPSRPLAGKPRTGGRETRSLGTRGRLGRRPSRDPGPQPGEGRVPARHRGGPQGRIGRRQLRSHREVHRGKASRGRVATTAEDRRIIGGVHSHRPPLEQVREVQR